MAESKKQQKSKKQSSGKSFVLMLLVCSILLVGVFLISAYFSKGSEDFAQSIEEGENIENSTPSKNLSGFPISFSNGIKTVYSGDDSIFVLSKNMLTVLKESGYQQYSEAFSFSESTLKNEGNYALVFDRQGSSYILLNNKKTFLKSKSHDEGYIITADVDKNGNHLIASRIKNATSALTYYDRSGKILFQWLCANEHIVSCDISSDKKSIVCAALGSSNGNIYTKVYYFNIKNSEKNKEYTFKNSACIDCFFAGRKKLVCNFDNGRSAINLAKKEGEPVTVSFSSSVLLRSNDSGFTAVITKLDSSFDKNLLTVYNSSNTVVYSCEVPNDVIDIQSKTRKAYLLTKKEVLLVAGGKSDVLMSVGGADGLCAFKGNIYYYSNSALYCK